MLAARLQSEGAHVRVYDPVADGSAPPRCSAARASAESALEALDGADAAVLVTEWPEFARARLDRRGQGADGATRWSSTGATSSTATR